MTSSIDSLVAQAKLSAEKAEKGKSAPGSERERLQQMATEFESMLLVQVIKDMRSAGKWMQDEEGGDQSGAASLFEMLDAEMASQLTKAQSFGMGRQMLAAFDRSAAVSGTTDSINVRGAGAMESVHVEDHDHGGDGGVVTGDDMAAKLRESHVTSSFGWRRDPFTGESKFHRGVDIRAAYGQDVQAMQPGKVVFSGEQGGYGTTVVVEHANGNRSRYAHLSASVVKEGDTVEAGQAVGRAGRSGRATGTHLHLEVTDADGVPQDPMK